MKKNKEKEVYCSYEYFMKHKCNGCKLGRECEEWNERVSKMDNSNNVCVSTVSISDDKHNDKMRKKTE